jgi:hypothetical protein
MTTYLFTSIVESFVFPSSRPVIQVNYTGRSREHQAQHSEQFEVKPNQVRKQDQLSTTEIHQANQIDGHRVIRVIELHQV